jgi:hypothetical protein
VLFSEAWYSTIPRIFSRELLPHELLFGGRLRQALAGIGGALGGDSRIRDVFIQHVKVGLWLDGPLTD